MKTAQKSNISGNVDNIKEYYEGLHQVLSKSIEPSCNVNKSKEELSNFLDELTQWCQASPVMVITPILKRASLELEKSSYLAHIGLYRQAFFSLRSFFELSLAGVHFSTNLLDLKEWSMSKSDLTWSTIMNPDNGLFSKRFVNAFFEGMEEYAQEFENKAATLYRQLSEYVHSNVTTWPNSSSEVTFCEEQFKKWEDSLLDVINVTSFVLVVRFMLEMSSKEVQNIQNYLEDRLMYLQPLRKLLKLPVGG